LRCCSAQRSVRTRAPGVELEVRALAGLGLAKAVRQQSDDEGEAEVVE
jgi:hypothetical protein